MRTQLVLDTWPCKPHLCGTTTKHQHCICGLPMEPKQRMCELCQTEGLCPTEQYPSWRDRRFHTKDPDCYRALFVAMNRFSNYL